MAIAKGVFRQFILASEPSYGVRAAAGAASQLVRRVQGQFVLQKDNFRSQEITPSMQVRDARHGVRRVQGQISGQLSPGTYKEIFENLLRGTFANGATTGAQTTIAAAAGPPGTFTRSAGSFLTDGFKVGDVVRWTGWTTTAVANNGRNYRIADLTATVMTVTGVGAEAVATKIAGDSVTCTVVGKKCFLPPSGQILRSHTMEVWQPDADTAFSKCYTGLRVGGIRLGIPATGYVTIDANMVGQDMIPGATRYFTAPTPMTTSNGLSAITGLVRFAGADVATITNAQLSIQTAIEANPVIGASVVPEVSPGMFNLDGNMNVYVRDQALFNSFVNEAEVDLHFLLEADATVNADFVSVVMNRVKLFSAAENDSDRSIIQQVQFQPLEHVVGAGTGQKFEATSITIQDSTL